MTAVLSHPDRTWVSWQDETDPVVTHLRIFGTGGVLHTHQPPPRPPVHCAPFQPSQPMPARLSPRPVRVLRRRLAGSQFAADLRDAAAVIGFLIAVVLVLVAHDNLHAFTAHLTGGNAP